MYFPSSKKLEHSDKFHELKRLSEGHLQLSLNQVVRKMLRLLIPWFVSSWSTVVDIKIFFKCSSLRGGGGKGLTRFWKHFFRVKTDHLKENYQCFELGEAGCAVIFLSCLWNV